MKTNMIENFEMLEKRVIDCLSVTDLEYLKNVLKGIEGPTLCAGSGGSKVVADFAAKVLGYKNECATKVIEPRDMLYENLCAYHSVFVCSYGGRNYGVEIAANNNLQKYLLSFGSDKPYFKQLKGNSSYEVEHSFISLGATLMPMSILLSYYLNGDITKLINEMFNKIKTMAFETISNTNLRFDIMSGLDTSTSATFLESTFTESGIAGSLIHSKYDFCHGRSTLPYVQGGNLIYLSNLNKELDYLLLSLLNERYKQIISLTSGFNDIIIDNFYLTLQAMYLMQSIARQCNVDLSNIEYDPKVVKKLYNYRGDM